MQFDEVKKLAIFLLQNYETAWQENAALHVLLENYPMPDGSKGVPRWKEIVDAWTSDGEGQARAHERFAPLYERIQSARQESEVSELLAEILRRLPKTGLVQ